MSARPDTGSTVDWLRKMLVFDIYSIAIAIVVVAGVALRAYHLGEQSLWVDELGEGTTAKAPLNQFFYDVRADFGAAPIDYLGVKLFTSVLGHGTVATRSWAFLMGSLAIFVIYRLGARLYRDRTVALIAAIMLAFSAFHIYYSQEARFYALPIVVGMLNIYMFLRALDSGALKDWALYSAATVVTLYSHYFLAILLPIEGLYLTGAQLLFLGGSGTHRTVQEGLKQVGLCLGAQVVAFLTLVPWLFFALPSQTSAGYDTLPTLGIARLHQIFVVLIGLAPLNSVSPGGVGQVLRTDLVLALALVGFVWALALGRMRVLLLAATIVFAIPLAWRSDQLGHYFWSERQVIFVLVPLYLLAAIGTRHLLGVGGQLMVFVSRRGWLGISEGVWRRRRPAIASGLAIVLTTAWVAAYWSPIRLVYQDRWLNKADWRGVAAYIDKVGCPDSEYWTSLNAHYSYGLAYYDPTLTSRSHFLFVLPDGSYNGSPLEAIRSQKLGASDWIVLDSGIAASSTTAGTVDSELGSLGWSPTSFLGLVVYHRETCGD